MVGAGKEKTLRVWSRFLCVHLLLPRAPVPTLGGGRKNNGPQGMLLLGSKGSVTSSLSPSSSN